MPRTTTRLRRRRLGGLLTPPAPHRGAQEPHDLDDGFVFWPESLGPRPSDGPALVRVGTATRPSRRPGRPRRRRVAGSILFAALFCGGAAFTASAGDKVAGLLGGTQASDPSAAIAGMHASPAAAAPALKQVQVPTPAPRKAIAKVSVAHVQPAAVRQLAHVASHALVAPARVVGTHVAAAPAVHAPARHVARVKHAVGAPKHFAKPMKARRAPGALAPEPLVTAPIEIAPSGAAFWDSVALPEPIPAALRLAPSFAQQLSATARRAGVDWALVLGVARAQGGRSANPVSVSQLQPLAAKLAALGAGADEWKAARALGPDDAFADRAVALARYDRAVGLSALVHGLDATKESLELRVLADSRLTIYAGGRDDIAQGHVDVRVLAVVEYLAETYGQVTVTSLISGHREFARPGVVSAHIYGRAVDVAALDGVSIFGHQQRDSITEHAVKALLLLPPEVEPVQIISLIGLGGPSFALADHYNHIHVGF